MTFSPRFVLSRLLNTFNHAFFEVYAQMVGARSQGPLADRKLDSHLPVMLNLRVSLIQVIVENELPFVLGQQFQTLRQTFRSVASDSFLRNAYRQHVSRDFLSPAGFENEITGHAVKVPRRIANVLRLDLRQSFDDAIDSFIRIVFRITQTFGDEDADQPGPNYFIPLTCFFAIRIEPLKQSVKWFLGDGQPSQPLIWGSIRRVPRMEALCEPT